MAPSSSEVGKRWLNMAAQYPTVLTTYVGEDGYGALVSMLDDRQREYTDALDDSTQAIDQRFGTLEDRLERRFEEIDYKFDLTTERVERRLAEEYGRLRTELHDGLGGIRTEIAHQRADLMKWAMVFWVSQAAAVAGIIVAFG
jgi:hypothetical protein